MKFVKKISMFCVPGNFFAKMADLFVLGMFREKTPTFIMLRLA